MTEHPGGARGHHLRRCRRSPIGTGREDGMSDKPRPLDYVLTLHVGVAVPTEAFDLLDAAVDAVEARGYPVDVASAGPFLCDDPSPVEGKTE